MPLEPEHIEKIDRYLCGNLSPEEASAFAVEIENAPDLAAQVEAQRQHLEAMELLLADDLREKMAAWRNGESQNLKIPPAPKPVFRHWRWAAAVLVLLGSLVFFTREKPAGNVNGTALPQQITDSISKKFPGEKTLETPKTPEKPAEKPEIQEKTNQTAPTIPPKYIAEIGKTRGETQAFMVKSSGEILRGDNSKTTCAKGVQAAAGGDFSGALALLKSVEPDSPAFVEAMFFQSVVLLKLGRAAEAIPLLKPLAANSGYLRQEQAEWFLAVSLLAENRVPEAEVLLKKMALDSGHGFSGRAKTVAEH